MWCGSLLHTQADNCVLPATCATWYGLINFSGFFLSFIHFHSQKLHTPVDNCALPVTFATVPVELGTTLFFSFFIFFFVTPTHLHAYCQLLPSGRGAKEVFSRCHIDCKRNIKTFVGWGPPYWSVSLYHPTDVLDDIRLSKLVKDLFHRGVCFFSFALHLNIAMNISIRL